MTDMPPARSASRSARNRIAKQDFRQRAPSESPPRIWACAYSRLQKWEYDNLAMPYWRWYWCPDSGAVLFLRDRKLALNPRSFVLIPPMTPFGTTLRSPVGQLYMHFDMEHRTNLPCGEVLVHFPDAGELRAAARLRDALFDDDAAAGLTTALLAHGVLTRTLAAQPSGIWERDSGDSRMRQAVELIRSRFPRVTPNTRLASDVAMHPSAFIRRFRQCLGLTPLQYLHHLRIEKAEEWLREGRLSIEDIAERLGFCDRFHFSRAFQRMRQMTPAVFRRIHRASGPQSA